MRNKTDYTCRKLIFGNGNGIVGCVPKVKRYLNMLVHMMHCVRAVNGAR